MVRYGALDGSARYRELGGSAGQLDSGTARLGWMARLGNDSARLRRLNIWRARTTRVFNLWRAWLRVGDSHRIVRRRVRLTAGSELAVLCTSEFILFLTTLKIQVYPKTLLFSDERGSDTNCWWGKPVVVALEHSEGIKHTILLQKQKLTITQSLQYTPSLSLFSFPY